MKHRLSLQVTQLRPSRKAEQQVGHGYAQQADSAWNCCKRRSTVWQPDRRAASVLRACTAASVNTELLQVSLPTVPTRWLSSKRGKGMYSSQSQYQIAAGDCLNCVATQWLSSKCSKGTHYSQNGDRAGGTSQTLGRHKLKDK